MAGKDRGAVKANQVHRDKLGGVVDGIITGSAAADIVGGTAEVLPQM